mmetsp:Transcript_35932/g.36371  ORF Transcript_35932/g.36371 Transcript_35932/m.36371 type:complete len:520 (-) Transcript_35932:253-1812(-)
MTDCRNEETIHPPCLSLCIHSSILLTKDDTRSSDDENEIFLPISTQLGHNNLGKRTSNNLHDNYVCTSEEIGDTSHLFMVTQKQQQDRGNVQEDKKNRNRSPTLTPTIRRFDFLASSTTRQRIAVQPTDDQLKDYGKRARDRSQQQRENRKEIKVIDSCLVVDQVEKQRKKRKPSKAITNASSNIHTNSGAKKRPRPHHHHQTKLNNTKVARKAKKLWTPDISHLPIPSIDNQSKYVQLHGLPVGTTNETIRKFFTGLIPQRILLLLNNRIDIAVLDASPYYNLPCNLQESVYDKDLRVLVQFDSISGAGLARDRSEETIFSKQLVNFYHPERRDEKTLNRVDRPDAFSIGITIISKDSALSLSKLSIDAIPGVPLHNCLLEVESKLKHMVREILWTNAQQECKVAVDKKIKSADLNIRLTMVGREEKGDIMNLLTFSGYQKYANHYNRLLTMYEDLLMTMPPSNSDEAMISLDPIFRLTAQACSVLDDEMDRIDKFLYQVRTTRKCYYQIHDSGKESY